jgi:hypothetical protein
VTSKLSNPPWLIIRVLHVILSCNIQISCVYRNWHRINTLEWTLPMVSELIWVSKICFLSFSEIRFSLNYAIMILFLNKSTIMFSTSSPWYPTSVYLTASTLIKGEWHILAVCLRIYFIILNNTSVLPDPDLPIIIILWDFKSSTLDFIHILFLYLVPILLDIYLKQ